MPFTLAHPAAVAPFWPLVQRNYLPLCALVIGTLSPDFEYLWRLRPEWRWSHAPLGVLYFCLPIGLLALGIWVYLVRAPVRQLLAMPPSSLATPFRWWLLGGVAIAAGAATHVAWDGFTHRSGWATRLVPLLREPIWVGGVGIPVFNILQHLSTLLGGLVVMIWLVEEVRTGDPRALLKPWRLAVLATLSATASAVGVWNVLRGSAASDYWTLKVQVGRAAVGGLLGLGLALIAYGAVYQFVASRSRVPSRLSRR
jgi:hypothetical protein